MRRADAPPAGWYPDPTSRTGLRWWDGLDWTDHRRPRPTPSLDDALEQATTAAAQATPAGGPPTPTKSQVRSMAGTAGRSRAEASEMMAEVRAVAREEVDRAVTRMSDTARDATRRLEPLLSQYGDRAMAWIRNLGIIAIVLVVLWMVLQTVAQTSVLDWLGDRVDNLLGGWAVTPPSGALLPW